MGNATAGEFWFARLCFIVAAIDISGLGIYWILLADKSSIWKLVVGAMAGAIIAPSIIGALLWVNSREVPKESISSESNSFPDVTLRFIYPKSPALQLINRSDKVARDIKYTVVIWNLDLPDRVDPLPIPVSTFDWIRPHETGGPQNLFFTPTVAPLLNSGNRLLGSASVICPDCARGHTFVIYIVWEQGGWFAEVPDESTGNILTPKHFTKGEIAKYAEQLFSIIPEHSRIPIEDP
jgi:hypothetical protein